MDWFAIKKNTGRLGHWYQNSKVRANDDPTRKKLSRYVSRQPYVRASQKFQQYTSARLVRVRNANLQGKSFGGTAVMQGSDPVEFVSIIGLRKDEAMRVARVKERNRVHSFDSQHDKRFANGEHVYTPLYDADISRKDVVEFWSKQSWDLEIPHEINLSNCVFCFMKGRKLLTKIAAKVSEMELPESFLEGPASIDWWAYIENAYTRRVDSKRNAGSSTRFGFFGADSTVSYESIRDQAQSEIDFSDNFESLPCACTD